jgi:hypothetical protein
MTLGLKGRAIRDVDTADRADFVLHRVFDTCLMKLVAVCAPSDWSGRTESTFALTAATSEYPAQCVGGESRQGEHYGGRHDVPHGTGNLSRWQPQHTTTNVAPGHTKVALHGACRRRPALLEFLHATQETISIKTELVAIRNDLILRMADRYGLTA